MLRAIFVPAQLVAATLSIGFFIDSALAKTFGANIVENRLVRVGVDSAGNLTDLTNLQSGWNYAGRQPLWRVFYSENDVRDIEAASVEPPSITAEASSITVRYAALQSPQKRPLKIAVELRASIQPESDDVHWTIAVENHQPGVVVTEVQFPLVGGVQLRPGQALILSRQGGQRIPDPKQFAKSSYSAYMAPDQNGSKATTMYPGFEAATNCFVYDGKEEGLYFGSHDPSLQSTLHLWRFWKNELQTGFVKYPFLASGDKYISADFVLSPYSGAWHTAAKKYRAWADTWFHPPKKPEWVAKMSGWQRIILTHQYGESLHPYNTIAQIASSGRAFGIDSLLLFGWWKAGMDAGYPDYVLDDAQGGREALAAQIHQAQKEGARVQLYFNGRLIDKESEFYRSGEGQRVAIKDLRGNEWNESYHFSGNGTTSRQLGRKTFVVACPTSEQWQKRRLQWVELALSLGADAVFFDQMGMNEMPCTDGRHGHPVPLVSFSKSQAAHLREIHKHVRSINPEAAFGTEIITDIVASEVDFLHSVGGMYGPTGFVEWFRYIFPEVLVSDREIYDDNDIERRVNLLLTRGLRSDVCVWRCRGTIADTPHYADYLGKVNELRKKHSTFLLEGTYRDNEPLRLDNALIDARAFQSGNELLVAMAQSELPAAKGLLQVPGYRFVTSDGLGDYQATLQSDGIQVSLKRNAVALAIFRKL